MERKHRGGSGRSSVFASEKRRRRFGCLRISLYAAAALLLAVIPTRVFDGFSLCLFYNLFHIRCPGCGLTRAFSSVMHFEPQRAVAYNPLVLALFPLLAVLAAQDAYRVLTRRFRGGERLSWVEKLLIRMGF